MSTVSTLKSWLLNRYFTHEVDAQIRAAVKVIDDDYWRDMTTAHPLVKPWHEIRSALEAITATFDTNPLAARLVHLTTDFVIGEGGILTGPEWAHTFWDHPLNYLNTRIYRWCDELSKLGELFLILSRNPVNGDSYVREIPAIVIDKIETDPDDLERETRYHMLTSDTEGKWWPAPDDAGQHDQVMLHYTLNKPVGAIRGVSDLSQILKWLDRYDVWLKDRVMINKGRGTYLWQVKIAGALPGTLEAKRAQYSRVPVSGSIIITDDTEEWTAVNPKIGADDAEADGKAIRLMIAAGVGVPLHFLAEGESATRATAREMGTATYRHFAHRQSIFSAIIVDVITQVGKRAKKPDADIDVTFESVLAEDERVQPTPKKVGPRNDETD